MAETRIDHKERKKLKVTWAGEPQSLPSKPEVKYIRCNCDDGLQYETFRQSLFPYIQTGKELDADVELHIIKAQDSQEYPHWRIAQLYNEKGEPIAATKTASSPQREYRGRDEDKVDTRTRIMEIGEDWRAGKRKDNDPLVMWREIWLMGDNITQIKKVEPPKEISVAELKEIRDECNWSNKDIAEYLNIKPDEWKRMKGLDGLTPQQRIKLAEYIKQNPK